MPKKSQLRKYAHLVARMGANVQKGQYVRIQAGLDQPEFVNMVAEECYKLGARRVVVEWSYTPLDKTTYKKASIKELSEVREWEKAKMQYHNDVLAPTIWIDSDDPDALKGLNQEKISTIRMNRLKVIKPYRDAVENLEQWTIVGVPSKAWAKKVFPDLSAKKAINALWDAILKTSRADGEDPVKDWQEHNKTMHKHCDWLNSLDIEELHYESKNGTDFKIKLLKNSQFAAAETTALKSNISFNPNMPTEECFTSPDKNTAEGIIYASKPLSYQGVLIKDFYFKFHKGKVTEVYAPEHQDLLEQLIHMDEGASHLGEVALVPYDSPVNQTGILFYNTLYDENAVCHLALGVGFPECYKGYEEMSREEVINAGVNDSGIHVDFMVGTSDLKITAKTRDGKIVPIFVNGVFAK